MASLQETDINDDGFFTVPIGTTAQRPSTPLPGMLRWNTSLGYLEYYNSDEADWFEIGSSGGLYEFTEATFTPGSSTGQAGPSLTEARNGLTGPEASEWKSNTAFFNTSAGIQQWAVPTTGTYRIEAWGARGGNNADGYTGGLGARMRGDFSLTEGEVIEILIGQIGFDTTTTCGGANGGGGTFVVKSGAVQNSDILVIAGGGGGGGRGTAPQGRKDGTTSNDGQDGDGSVSNGQGGTGGNGGGSGSGCVTSGAGGGGFFGNGTPNGAAVGGQAFINGGSGGINEATIPAEAGFGGGGANDYTGGAGGGYSGGGGGGLPECSCSGMASGGGGGSFNNGENQSNSSGVNATDGQVTITLL